MDEHKKKMVAPVIITIVVVMYYAIYFGFLLALLDGIWKYALGVIPVILSAGMIWVCMERIHEIRKGEEDDLGQY